MRLGEFQKQAGGLDRESDVKGWSEGNLGGALGSKKQTEKKWSLFVECIHTQNMNGYGRTEKGLQKEEGNKVMILKCLLIRLSQYLMKNENKEIRTNNTPRSLCNEKEDEWKC